MNKAKRLEILTRLRENNPHPTTELNFSSPFELLIAVLLSAQATDVSVLIRRRRNSTRWRIRLQRCLNWALKG